MEDYKPIDNSIIPMENLPKGRDASRNVTKMFKRRETNHANEAPTSENLNRMNNKKKNQKDIADLLKILKTHFVFENYSKDELQQIVSKMFFAEAKKGTFIFKEQEVGSCFMVLISGLVEVIEDEKNRRQIKAHQAFGALSLLYGNPRSTSARCLENCTFWVLERTNLRKAIEEIETKEFESNRKIIDYCDFLNFLTPEQKELLACGFSLLKYSKGQIICQEGQPCCSLSIVKQGSISAVKDGEELRRFGVGEYFGETSLLYNTVKVCNLVAYEDVHLIVLGRESLVSILKENILVSAFRHLIKMNMEKSSNFSKVPKSILEKIVENMPCEYYKAGDIVMKKGSEVNKIIVSIDASLKSSKSGGEITRRGGIFGEDALFAKKDVRNKILDYDLLVDHDGVVALLTFEKIKSFFGGNIDEVIKQHQANEKNNRKNNTFSKTIAENLSLDSLIVVKRLKTIPLGKIYIVKKVDTNLLFVLYCYELKKIEEFNVDKHFKYMKEVLPLLDSTFVIQYYKTFKNENYFFVLAEYINGLDVVDILKRIGTLNTYDTQFYVASLLLAIESMHSKGIIHRDIKCENLIADQHGFIKLFSFYTSRIVKTTGSNQYAKCTTIIGTPHYMAPEIVIGKGYGFSVDVWSLGIVMYELMCGGVPFGEESEDPFLIFEEICGALVFPPFIKDKKAKKLMRRLLTKNPDERMSGSLNSIKEDPWFENFDWEKLTSKELQAPYIPVYKNFVEEEDINKADNLKQLITDELKSVSTIDEEGRKNEMLQQLRMKLKQTDEIRNNII